jgi:FkbM family methyltransferase
MYRLLNFIERITLKNLGKGYGANSIVKEVKLLKKFLNDPKLGIDIGGNIGNYSAQLRKKFPNLEIHLFEPSKTNHEKLRMRFGNDPKVYIIPMAVSELNGPSELFSNELGSGLGSLTKRNLAHFHIEFEAKELVEMIRFEDYWESDLLKEEIDVVKIDVEGHELAVLKGFGKAIDKTKVIQFEFGGCNIDTRTYFQDFWYFFKEHSFKLYRITPFGLQYIPAYSEYHESFVTTNYLCVNQNLK